MGMIFPNLFSKGKIGKTEIRNRIVMLPMSTNFPNENGGVTNELVDYYAERAKGGVGLVIVESAGVDYPRGKNGAVKLRCDQVNFIPGLSRLADAIHLYRAKALIQLQHAGSSTTREKTYGQQPVAPSTIENSAGQILARELTPAEIENIVADFAKAAVVAQEAGFDGVEVHGAHSYLIAQFLTPYFNKRTDEYGGTYAKRARFILEVIRSIRQKTGPNFIISARINGHEFTEGGLDVQDAKRLAVLLEKASVDILNISTGLTQHSDNLSMYYPQGWRVYLASEIRQAVKIPVITSGGIRDPQFAEDVLTRGEADFIGLGRGLIADPSWPAKAARGNTTKIRKCISCNVGCTGRRIFGSRSITCTVNPDVGQESRAAVYSCLCSQKRNVVVIGAGAAGINAAVEAKRRGHSVDVIEKGKEIGGLLNLAAVPYGKEILRSYIEYLRELAKEHNLRIHFNEEASLERVSSFNPDAVIFATGSRAIIPAGIPGIRNGHVIVAHDVLRRKIDIKNKNIVILGGGSVGCETADFLAENNKVTIIEMLSQLAPEAEKLNRADLLRRLEKLQVNVMLETRLNEVGLEKVIVKSPESQLQEIHADFVVLAVGAVPVLPEWAEQIRDRGIDCYVIGDACIPGQLQNAVSQGIAAGRSI